MTIYVRKPEELAPAMKHCTEEIVVEDTPENARLLRDLRRLIWWEKHVWLDMLLSGAAWASIIALLWWLLVTATRTVNG